MPQLTESDIEGMIKTFDNPVKSCAHFYGYYYLAEIEQDDFAAQLFEDIKDNMAQDFYNYAVYATLSELSNIKNHGIIRRSKIKQATREEGIHLRRPDDLQEEESVSGATIHIPSIPAKRKVMGRLLDPLVEEFHPTITGQDVFEAALEINGFKANPVEDKQDYVKGILQTADAHLDTLNEPRATLEVMKNLFTTEDNGIQHLRWQPPFGGKAWHDITKTVLTRDENPQNIWIDMMWALEHNTSTWVDKIPNTGEKQPYISKSVSQLPSTPPAFEQSVSTGKYNEGDILQQILDYKREGQFHKFWPFIVNADDRLQAYESTFRQAGR